MDTRTGHFHSARIADKARALRQAATLSRKIEAMSRPSKVTAQRPDRKGAVMEGREHSAGPQGNTAGRWWGECTCGWYGPVRETWGEAAAEADAHLIDQPPSADTVSDAYERFNTGEGR